MIKYGSVFLLFVFVCACSSNNTRLEKAAIYNTLVSLRNRHIQFPNNLVSCINGVQSPHAYVFGESEYKMVVYTDSSGCTPCKFPTSEWGYYINQLQILSRNINFVFIFQKESAILEEEFRIQGIYWPIIYDTANLFIQKNNLPTSARFHTFLLDKNEKIILVGSPVKNKKVWQLYKEMIKSSQ